MPPWMRSSRGEGITHTHTRTHTSSHHHSHTHTHTHTHTHPHRRISESGSSPVGASPAQAEVLEEIVRKASIKTAKEMADAQQQEYIQAEQKARAQEQAMRKVHQKQADKAMDVSPPLPLSSTVLMHTYVPTLPGRETGACVRDDWQDATACGPSHQARAAGTSTQPKVMLAAQHPQPIQYYSPD